jgi:hypothetical protein
MPENSFLMRGSLLAEFNPSCSEHEEKYSVKFTEKLFLLRTRKGKAPSSLLREEINQYFL